MEINTTIYINESELTEKITTKLCKEIKESVKESVEAYIPIAVEKFCSDSRNVEVAVKDAFTNVLYDRYKTGFEYYPNVCWNDQELMDRMKISEIITDKYKLRIPPTVYYELLADVQEMEEVEE